MGVNRHFQAKHAKYSNFCISKTTEAIPTKFLHSDKDHKVGLGLLQYTHGCWSSENFPHKSKKWRTVTILRKRINCYISATALPIYIKFCTLTHIATLNPSC